MGRLSRIIFTRSFTFILISHFSVLVLIADNGTIIVHPEDRQVITHWGATTQNRPDWGAEWDIKNSNASLEAVYEELGLTIQRVDFLHDTYSSENAKKQLRDTILAGTERGLAWYGVPWSAPPALKVINDPRGKVDGVDNYLRAGEEGALAQWLVDTTLWLMDQGVPAPVALSVQNEPDYAPPYDGCLYTADQLRKTAILLREKLDAAGLEAVAVTIGDNAAQDDNDHPEDDPNFGTVNMLGLYPGGAFETDPHLQHAVGIISTHTYDVHNNLLNSNPEALVKYYRGTHTPAAVTKQNWMTEWEPRHEHTFSDWEVISEMMSHFNRDLSSLEFNAWFHWQPWKHQQISAKPEDTGECLVRIRPGAELTYADVDFGAGSELVKFRVGANHTQTSVSLRLDSADGEVLGSVQIPNTGNAQAFQTVIMPIQSISGVHDVCVTFEASGHWWENSFNWFSVNGANRIEAESYAGRVVPEPWQAKPAPAYNVNTRNRLVYADENGISRRPLFYIFKKLFNAAPADGRTYMRLVTTDDPDFQGATRTATPSSFRQDFSAFVNGEKTLLTVLNRNEHAKVMNIEGLTGDSATLYRYDKADAETIDQDLRIVGTMPVVNGALSGISFPAESITLIQTSGPGGAPAARSMPRDTYALVAADVDPLAATSDIKVFPPARQSPPKEEPRATEQVVTPSGKAGAVDRVTFSPVSPRLPPAMKYSFDLSYDFPEQRTLLVIVWNADWKIIGDKNIRVPAGAGAASVEVPLKSLPVEGPLNVRAVVRDQDHRSILEVDLKPAPIVAAKQ